jgi:hypothetical protein
MSLLALQRDFQAWLKSESVEIAARFGDPARAGLAVYLNNYRSQLLACLTASFPTARAWIGDIAFDGAAATHVDRVPPQAWTLDSYGLDFHETLEMLYPEDPEVAELARLESSLAVAFVGPDATAVDPAALADIDWDNAIIHLVPTFALLPVTTNVAALRSAIQDQQTPPPAVRLPERASIAIWRDRLAPMFRTVTAQEATIFEQVRARRRFGEICADLIKGVGEERGTVIAGSMLRQWLTDRVIVDISS